MEWDYPVKLAAFCRKVLPLELDASGCPLVAVGVM